MADDLAADIVERHRDLWHRRGVDRRQFKLEAERHEAHPLARIERSIGLETGIEIGVIAHHPDRGGLAVVVDEGRMAQLEGVQDDGVGGRGGVGLADRLFKRRIGHRRRVPVSPAAGLAGDIRV